MGMSHRFSRRHQLLQKLRLRVKITLSQVSGVLGGEMDLPAHIRDQLVDVDQLAEALSKRPPRVQRLRVAVQLRPHIPNILNLLPVVHPGGAGIHLKALLQLVQHHLFRRLIGVQLQAEILDSQGGKALLHHLQGGHFLRHKQNRLLLRQGVGDHGGDRL